MLVGAVDGLHEIGDGIALPGREVLGLSSGASGLRAVVGGLEIWGGDGSSWDGLADSPDLRLNCLLDTGDVLWVGAAEGVLFRLADDALERVTAFDEVKGRER